GVVDLHDPLGRTAETERGQLGERNVEELVHDAVVTLPVVSSLIPGRVATQPTVRAILVSRAWSVEPDEGTCGTEHLLAAALRRDVHAVEAVVPLVDHLPAEPHLDALVGV